MAQFYYWFASVIKYIGLYCLLLLLVCGLQLASPVVAQEPLQITDIDLSEFPQVRLIVQHSNLRSDEVSEIQVWEDNEPQETQVHLLRRVRVGLLADIYLGLNSEIASRLADAVDDLDNQSWQWEQMERSLFVPVGEAGEEVTSNPEWTKDSWRIISNTIASYFNAQDETFKPRVSKTALLALLLDTLSHYEQSSATDNYLIVLTDGFDGTCIDTGVANQISQACLTKIDEIVLVATSLNVQIYFVNYDRLTNNSRGFVLGNLATNLSTEVYPLIENNTLLPVWQRIAQNPIISEFTYVTEHFPPFSLVAQTNVAQSNSIPVEEEVPPVIAEIIEPQPDTSINSSRSQVKLALDWGGYPPRDLSRVTYRIAGSSPMPVINRRVLGDNQLAFMIAGIPEGQPLLDIILYEKLENRAVIVQARLTAAFPLTPTPIPTSTPAPTPLPTPTPTTIWDSGVDMIERFVLPQVPENIRTNRNITQPLSATFPLLVLVTLLVALRAWWKAKRPVIIEGVYPPPQDPTTRKTTEVPLDSRPVAQLILIQGERSLPAIIPLYEGRTKFGRDPSWADELLSNRFVSLQQFAISIGDDYHNIANFSERNQTTVDGIPAREGAEEDPEQGSPLKSGSIIQFGPFKYKFQFNTQFGSTTYPSNGQTTTVTSIGSSNV